MKGKVAGIANYGDVNYIRIKRIGDIKGIICKFLSEIDLDKHWYFDEEYDRTGKPIPFKYDKLIDKHTLFENKNFKVHVIFGKNYLHMLVITKNREKLNKALSKYFAFVKAG